MNILKHEIPSPSNEQLKQPKSPQVSFRIVITYNIRFYLKKSLLFKERSGHAVNHQQTHGGTVVNTTAKDNNGNDHPPILQKAKNQPDLLDSSSNSNLGMLLL